MNNLYVVIFVTILLIRKNLQKDNTNLRYIKVKIIIILISGSWKKKECPYRVYIGATSKFECK